jgi:hypothetical protein
MSGGIDKSVLAFPEPRRLRDKDHLKFVSTQPCLICGRQPADAPAELGKIRFAVILEDDHLPFGLVGRGVHCNRVDVCTINLINIIGPHCGADSVGG